jgi:hypothetical protein
MEQQALQCALIIILHNTTAKILAQPEFRHVFGGILSGYTRFQQKHPVKPIGFKNIKNSAVTCFFAVKS